MTEEQAKTKWCPMVRIVVVNDHIQENRHGQFRAVDNDGTGPFCIGSACMMWREEQDKSDTNPRPVDANGKPSGFCGLAGRWGNP